MGYLHDVDAWLAEELEKFRYDLDCVMDSGEVEDAVAAIKRILKQKILESYHNGLRDAQKRKKAYAPENTSRPRQRRRQGFA